MLRQPYKYPAGSKRPAASTSGTMSTPMKRQTLHAKSPRPAFPFEPPTVGVKVHPNGHQVQSADSIKDLSSAKKRLFDIIPDSQSAPLNEVGDEFLSSDSGKVSDVIHEPKKKFPCQLCHLEFSTEPFRKQHQRNCRRKGSHRVVAVKTNGWTCSICQTTGNAVGDFKRHIFYKHNDEDVQQ